MDGARLDTITANQRQSESLSMGKGLPGESRSGQLPKAIMDALKPPAYEKRNPTKLKNLVRASLQMIRYDVREKRIQYVPRSNRKEG